MEDIKIEKGVPLPRANQRGFGLADVLAKMEVGDSFLVPKHKRQGLFAYFRNAKPAKFTSRTVDEENVRVWRVE